MNHTIARHSRWAASAGRACVAATLVAATAPAWSVTTLSFTGQLGLASNSQAVTPTTLFDFWGMNLDTFTPFAITEGDEIAATVALDGTYMLPGAPGNRFIRLFFNGTDLAPLDPVDTSGGIELFLAGNSVLTVPNQGCGTSTALVACVVLDPPSTAPISFDAVKFTFTVTTLNGLTPATVESAYFDTVVTAPVPEASTWAMLGAGLAVVGAAARRRRSPALG